MFISTMLQIPSPIVDIALTLTLYLVLASSLVRIVEVAGGDTKITVSLQALLL